MSKRSVDGELITVCEKIKVNEESTTKIIWAELPDVAQLRILSFLSINKIYQIRTVSFIH